MVGQYPGQNPEVSGPTADDVERHLSTLLNDAGVNLFVSLQSEIPPQNDYDAWSRNHGEVYLEGFGLTQQFPKPFTHYAPVIDDILSLSSASSATDTPNNHCCNFVHWPIDDLSVPSNSQSLNDLLLRILTELDEDNHDDAVVYIHCWGGRGRAGLVASCLLSLLFPQVEAKAILDVVQAGYDTRLGAKEMPFGLSRSPQTESQRVFVREFVRLRQRRE